jgi:putative DNA methylase
MPTKLIEVALPLDAINREAAREKTIRHGHPFTLHLWWARRPLAACRAVLFAQLVDDPSSHPDRFPTGLDQERERQRLFGLVERLVRWEGANDHALLEEVRAEIRRSCGDHVPAVLDPFCGGGSIPLEAQRLGLVAEASDLNPVAVLISKALAELPARFANRPPVHPTDDSRFSIGEWSGSQGLAEDIRFYGTWMREEAGRRIGHLYPKATLPGGSRATVMTWIWARTITCPNPACRATMPLVRSFWLGKKKGKEAWIRPIVEGRTVRFEIGLGSSGPPANSTVSRTGATCLVCNTPVPLAHVRVEGKAGRIGAQLMAVVAEGARQRVYLPPDTEQEKAADIARPDDFPDSELPEQALGFRVQGYGMTHHADLFTNRQLTALCTFSDLVKEARDRVIAAGGETAYADAVATYLAFTVDRLADLGNALCPWEPIAECPRHLFGRQAIPMAWDHAEGNPFSDSSGGWSVLLEGAKRAFDSPAFGISDGIPAEVGQKDVRQIASGMVSSRPVIATDPPYYDNVAYADLADFFYVWLRRSLSAVYPDLFTTVLTPKAAELVADPFRFGGDQEEANRYFEAGFENTFGNFCAVAHPDFPLTLFYAFKQVEQDEGGGAASTGWETMLAGLLRSGLAVTATWPMRTEASNRMRNQGSNALASSIVLACRRRSETAGITDRRGFLATLRAELPHRLRELQQGSVAPVDLAQAAIGPGMAVFSSYARVIEPNGENMPVRTALALINQALDEVLSEQEAEFDEDTRWAIAWYSEHGMDYGPFGRADDLSRAKNVSVEGLKRAGIVSSGGGRVRLIDRTEMDSAWDPVNDSRLTIWEVTQQLIRRLLDEGEGSAADLLARVGGLGDPARDLAYRLFQIAESKKWAKEAGPYNALGAAWRELSRRAAIGPMRQGRLI